MPPNKLVLYMATDGERVRKKGTLGFVVAIYDEKPTYHDTMWCPTDTSKMRLWTISNNPVAEGFPKPGKLVKFTQ